MIIGLTGGIACGKSTVARMLERRGAAIVDADLIAREVVEPGSPVLDQIAERFGRDVLNADGSLNRKRLADIVFSDAEAKRDLEQLTHPAIRARIRERIARLERERPQGLNVADIPLLYESGLEHEYPEIMVVYVPESVQLRRLMERDGLDERQAMSRIRAQIPIEEKKRRADIVIDNSGSLRDTEEQVDRFWRGKFG